MEQLQAKLASENLEAGVSSPYKIETRPEYIWCRSTRALLSEYQTPAWSY